MTTTVSPALRPTEQVYAGHPEKKVTLYFLVTGLVLLLIGVAIGPLQALNYAGIDVYRYLPFLKSYYQGLSLHGVLNALVFTTYFISGLLLYLPCRALKVRPNLLVAWGAYWTMTAGVLMAAAALLTNNATLLYTFYPPLQGSPLFYIGAALLVVGSLIIGVQVIVIWTQWKRQHPGEITPLVAFMSVATWMMWLIASLGLVVEVVFLLIPWSLGWVKGVDPLLARTLFWYTGHPIVYFWVMPAYISWYALLPGQAGGKIASETMARLSFVLFLLLSTPVGLHHQFADTGISMSWKVIQMLLTFLVVIPSLLTAFSVGASLEIAARLRGGGGWVGWIRHLPWKDPVFTAQVLAMVSFIPGGAGGIVNASIALDSEVHNTAWIPGHFHITVGTATTLTFFAVSFWLLPHLTRKPLASVKGALWASWLWFWGMIIFAIGMHWEGLIGIPRRTYLATATGLGDMLARAQIPMALTGISGMVLMVASIFYFSVIFRTLLGRQRVAESAEVPIPVSESLEQFEAREAGLSAAGMKVAGAVRLMERLWIFFALALALVVLMYLPMLIGMVLNTHLLPGQRLW
ncbi:cbb3-type cytochrome c oxidase subunit I [Deinococcus ruber]|uniref:Cytochrome c oxidase subunit 1 n=1 Tax=Deinococcus ruber TaxID=1848197 RepID=A0A918F2X9_9DEIO|nr:cbb3-type cytochrome c oxidase subunit I [Deinococcus ruber]GGR03269.1 cytochrome c oxidase subunit 1 [Deinococcus ruber]